MSDDRDLVRLRWDAEYARGRYSGEPPVKMISRIKDIAQRRGLNEGLYIGCGNGRNYIPLRDAGLKLVGIDISTQAIEQLRRLQPAIPADSLLQGTVHDLPADMSFPLVVGSRRILGDQQKRTARVMDGPGQSVLILQARDLLRTLDNSNVRSGAAAGARAAMLWT
jgi:hypothetical protein